MTGKTLILASSVFVAAGLLALPANAADKDTVSRSDYEKLEHRVDQLELQLQNKSDQQSSDHTRLSTLEQSFNDVTWTLDNGRPTIKSGDNRFQLSLRLRVQEDFAEYNQDSSLPASVTTGRDLGSGALTRRAFFGVEGKAFSDFWYEFRLNLAGSGAEGSFANATGDPVVNLARVAYQGIPHFRLNVGVIEPVFVYGQSVSSGALTFIERPAAVNAAASLGGNDARRGIEMDFQKVDALMPGDNVALSATFSGQRTGTPHNNTAIAGGSNDEGDFVNGRAVYRFWSDGVSNIQLGVDGGEALNISGAHGAAKSFNFANTPEINVDNTSLINTSISGSGCGLLVNVSCTAAKRAWTYGFEGGANWRNFYIAGEYYKYGIERDFDFYDHRSGLSLSQRMALHHSGDPEYNGWYVEGSWVITGEAKAYSASNSSNNYAVWDNPRVITPFSLDGHSWGAWELAARYSELNLNWNEGGSNVAVPVGSIRGGDQKVWTVALNWYLNNNIRTGFDYLHVNVDKLNAAGLKAGQNFDVVAARLQVQF